MAMQVAVVRIRVSDLAADFLTAVADLLAVIEDADPALLEDSIAEAAGRVVEVLRSPRDG